MKAAVLYGKNNIKYDEIPEPTIEDDKVKINVKICGICKSDVPRVLNGTAHYFPIILGHEFSGIVTEIGKNVENVKVGDRVAGIPLIPCFKCENCKKGNYSLCKHYSFIGSREAGGYAEYVVVPSTNVVKFDDSISFEKGALFEPSTVALHALKVAKFKKNSTVAIVGLGTIGTFVLQWCRIYGAKKIVVFSRTNDKEELAKRLGATDFVGTDDMEEINKIYPNGFDYVFETSGTINTIKKCFYLAANKGVICYIGTPTKDFEVSWKWWEIINRKEISVTGSWMSYSKPFPGTEWLETATAFKDGSLIYDEEIIHDKVSLDKVDEIFKEFSHPNKIKGRVLLKIDENKKV